MTYKFFEKKQISTNSSEESSEEFYEFSPVKNDDSDELTESLFEQLEEGYVYGTDIYGTIKSGANLYAKKVKNDFEGCYPIHIAAYNISSNTGGIESILTTFNDPEKRRKYIYLKNQEGENAFQILIDSSEEDTSIAVSGIISILSYLNPTEQQEIMNSISKESKSSLEFKKIEKLIHTDKYKGDIVCFEDLIEFFLQQNYIEMCPQRKREESQSLIVNHDFKQEKLGGLGSVYNKKFTARVSYTTGINNELVPELILIPSDWRLQTAVENNNQGDHVIAYVLLLSSLSHCQGEEVKKLPSLICNLASSVLPDHKGVFVEDKKKIKKTLQEQSKIRVDAIFSLRIECDKTEEFLKPLENNLKKVEIESIARYVEDAVDKFITTINKLEGESFSQERKKGVTINLILQKMLFIIDEVDFLKEKKYADFKDILKDCINQEASNKKLKGEAITDKILKDISDEILKCNFKKINIPECMLGKSKKLTQTTLLAFLKENTPLKKYHEGQAINDIKTEICTLSKTTHDREINLKKIGQLCAKLFDYPRVGNPKLDNEYVLYQAIPRHFIIINAAFIQLKNIKFKEKKIVYNSFLTQILVLQLWHEHCVLDKDNKKIKLDLKILKEQILKFANLDESHNFTMKCESEYPSNLKGTSALSLSIKK